MSETTYASRAFNVFINHPGGGREPGRLCAHGTAAEVRALAAEIFDVPAALIHLEAVRA